MLVLDFATRVYSNVVRRGVGRAEELDLVIVVQELRDDDPDIKYIRLVCEARIDGLVIASGRESCSLIDELRRAPIPYLFVNRRIEGASRSVLVNNKAAAALAAEALIAAGHQELGMVAGPEDIEASKIGVLVSKWNPARQVLQHQLMWRRLTRRRADFTPPYGCSAQGNL